MAGVNQQSMSTFDFSQDAQAFKARLWKKLQTRMAVAPVHELEDDDLEWVNAAGMPVRQNDEDPV